MNPDKDFASKQIIEHVSNVAFFIDTIIKELEHRKVSHDKTKLEDPEIKYFSELLPKLKASTYNSEEYKDFLKQLKPALDHHYKHNRHHPEHFDNGIDDMNLIDLIEMFCDWKAATLRHADGSLQRSIEISKERFKVSSQLESIFKNTIDILNKEKKEQLCQVCKGKLEYYFHRFWGWIFGSCYRCTECGRKWTDKTGPK